MTSAAAPRVWTVLDLLRWTTDHFTERGIEGARLDAECLLAHALETDRLRLYLQYDMPVGEPERARFRDLVRRRGRDRVPVAQITGTREFWSLPVTVTPEVLTPRPETEKLVSVALDLLAETPDARVLEIGTGSGAVALALATERSGLEIVASDLSGAALDVARANAERLGLDKRIDFREGSLFEPVAGERFHLILSNPPYIAEAEADRLPPELAHEPRMALFGGRDGTDVLRAIVAGARGCLEPEGALALEIDPGQARAAVGWFEAAGFVGVSVTRDLAERERVVAARLGGV